MIRIAASWSVQRTMSLLDFTGLWPVSEDAGEPSVICATPFMVRSFRHCGSGLVVVQSGLATNENQKGATTMAERTDLQIEKFVGKCQHLVTGIQKNLKNAEGDVSQFGDVERVQMHMRTLYSTQMQIVGALIALVPHLRTSED